jgi:MoxR-like ATPase
LDHVGYLADAGLATAAFLAVRMGRPLFCEGEPGTGKTALALAIAEALELPLIRLQCHEGIDASQALYDWDFPRQLPHLRTLEALADGNLDAETVEASLYTQRFLLARPLLRALREGHGAAGGRVDVQPDPRGARRAQAPLPLPLGGAPGPDQGDRDPDPAAARQR